MSAVPLRLVDPETGEITESACRACAGKDDVISGLQTNVAGWMMKCAKLERDVEEEHRSHPDRERVERLHASWQRKTRHPNSQLDFGDDSRFEAYLRGLKLAKKVAKKMGLDLDPEALCERAFDGAAHDPYTRTARNGNVERYDDATTIFKNAPSFERFVNRAPRRAT